MNTHTMASGSWLALCFLAVLSVFLTPGHCEFHRIDLQSSSVRCSMSSIYKDDKEGQSMNCTGAINNNEDTTWKHLNDSKPNCVYTKYESNAYWLVDLGQPYNIHRITIYPETGWNYMRHRRVFVDGTKIFEFPDSKISDPQQITGSKLPIRGQVIKLTRDDGYVTLCELQVDDCTSGSYGVDCKESCSPGCRANGNSATCDSISGNCIQGCEREWWGGRCDMPCPSRCTVQCDRDTGCEECQDNSAPPDCQDCTFGYYGKRCDFLCGKGCVNNNCNRQDGACTCLTGWFAPNCTECTVTRWSADCSRSCGQCAGDGSCDMDTGRCISGCLEGFDGDDCTLKVMSSKDSDSITVLLVGGVLGAGALLGVSVLLAAFIIRGRQRPHDSASSGDPNGCQTGVSVPSGDVRTRDNADGDATETEPQPSGSSESDYTPLEIYENPYLIRPYGVLRIGRGHAASGNAQGDDAAALYQNIEVAKN